MARSVCQIEEDGKPCGKEAVGRGMCPMHYRRWNLYGDALRAPTPGRVAGPKGRCAAVDDGQQCEATAVVRGLCRRHYARAYANGTLEIVKPNYRSGPRPTCPVVERGEKCGQRVTGRGYCAKHYARFRKHGDPLVVKLDRTGEFRMNGDGYMARAVVLDGVREYQREHRVVMEQILGRRLLPGENVHHIDGDKANNRPENLELWTTSQPSGQRVTDKVAWCIEFLEAYAPEVLAAKPTQLRLVS